MSITNKSATEAVVNLAEVGKLIDHARVIAKEYRSLTGRPLGITGEVAEYEAARILNLQLAKVRQAGYDAKRSDGTKIQIKGRVRFEGSKTNQRLGRLQLNKEWDSVILVMLDNEFMPISIHEASRARVKDALTAPGSITRNVRGALSVGNFISIAKLIWQREV